MAEQPHVAAFFESRILFAAHATLDQAERFASLSAHSDLVVAETRALVNHWYADARWLGGRVLVEKEPMEAIALPDGDYERFLRHVDMLFPERRLLLMMRDPVSVVWSMRNRTWGESLEPAQAVSWSLDDCIDTWRRNARVAIARADDPTTLVCRFEDLVADPKGQSRSICEFLGIESWTDFEPLPTKIPSFATPDIDQILSRTTEERALLGYT